MLTIIEHEFRVSDVNQPRRNMIREKNKLEVEVLALPKKYNAPPRHRQRVIVMVFYHITEFMNIDSFEIASASCQFDIFTNRDLYLIELYGLTVRTINRSREYFTLQKLPFLKTEEFPTEPPDVIRAKMIPELRKINQSKDMHCYELN